MATNRLKISLEIEPIVLLKCANKECRHNLANSSEGYIACNLKRLIIGQETVKVKGESLPALHYRMKTDKFLIDLWYSPDQRWLALDSTLENGRVIHYRME